MCPLCWTRIDDRLIHGQVTTVWRRYLDYEAIVIIDDLVAADPMLVDVLHLAAPVDTPLTIYTTEKAVAALQVEPQPRTLLLLKAPQTALALIQKGLDIAQINVGNIAAAPGKKRAFQSISLGPDEVTALNALAEQGVAITFQATPEDTTVRWQTLKARFARRSIK